MNRKQFLKRLGLLFGAAIVAPSVLAETKKTLPPPNTEGDWWFAGDKETLPHPDNEFTITIQNISSQKLPNVSVTGFQMHQHAYEDVIYKVNGNVVTQNAVKRIFSQPAIYEKFTANTNMPKLPGFYLDCWDGDVLLPQRIIKPIFSNSNYGFILDPNSSLMIKEMLHRETINFTFKVKAKREPMLVINGCKGIGKSYGPHDFNKFKNI